MKKLATIVLGILFLATAAGADPIPLDAFLDYTTVEVEPGMFQYTFTVYANDGVNRSFSIESLVFSGDIQQMMYEHPFSPGLFLDVHTPQGAGFAGPPYDINKDTWVFDGWTKNPPVMNMPIDNPFAPGPITGQDIVLSMGSGTTGVQQMGVAQIVAIGDVTWNGLIFRNQQRFPTNGVATAGGVHGDSQENPIMPEETQGPRGEWIFNNVDVPVIDGGAWFDPVGDVPAYLYETDGNSNFIAVMLPFDVPAGSDNSFIVNDGTGGVPVDAGDLFIFPNPVDSFIVSGIDPLADGDDPLGFPTFLQFDEQLVTFTQTGIPEPATMGLILFGVAGLLARRRRQR
jgi:hypothetical protein